MWGSFPLFLFSEMETTEQGDGSTLDRDGDTKAKLSLSLLRLEE
jgi:hypothetical protein